MKPQWKNFLDSTGAEYTGDMVSSFGNPVRERRITLNGTVFADLCHMGLISAQGEDAEKFLQGQFSNDVRQVSDSHSQLSAYCSPKGRMLAGFRIFRRGDIYYLSMPRERVEATLKRLRMFVLMSRVTLEDASETFVHIGVSGPDAVKEVQQAVGIPPQAQNEVTTHGQVSIIHLPGPHPRFELYGPLDDMKKVWSTLNVRCAPVGAGPWELLDILAGIPSVYEATVEAFVPQMTNLQLIGGVSFKKGCYTGQEVVARMQYLGKLKRRMYLARVHADTPPRPGDELASPQSESGQGAGRIVNSQEHPDGGYAVLAVIIIECAENGDVFLGDVDGPKLEIQPLPYALEQATA